MMAELVDIPAENRLVDRPESWHWIIILIHIHERRPPFLRHVVQDKKLITPKSRRKRHKRVPILLHQFRERLLLRLK